MRIPLSWLEEYVRPELELRDLAFRLAMTGTEVDRIHHHGVDAVEHFVVGKVLDAVQHPDADRLRVCTVDVGSGAPSQIVCGAPNVAAGQTVAVANPGSVMPDGTRLKAAKLRGVVSAGMICAEDELGLGADHAGIMVLDDALAAGTPLADVLPIIDEVLELEITPNRPDCLGLYGVAREIHAATGAPLAPPPWAEDPGTDGPVAGVSVRVESPRCARFTARVFEGVQIGPSPVWLKARLLAAGQRPINNVVDITNYAMLLTGQPLHAFDLDRIAGAKLTVRDARAGETLTTLDGVERALDSDVVLIEDADGPTSLAGVMGGLRSEVQDTTARVLLEVACWDGPNVNRTMARFDLRSEAGARNEKGLAPEQTLEAQAVATRLMLDLTGATLAPGTIDERSTASTGASVPRLRLRDARVARLLGAPVERDESRRVLEALGFDVEDAEDGLDVTVPPFRRLDVTREADVIEEVARLSALDTLPSTLPENRTLAAATLTPAQRGRRRVEDALVGMGLSEVAGWSFTNVATLAKLRVPDLSHVTLVNPMSEAQAILRPTIVGSLLDVAAHNVARGAGELAIFESAPVYRPGGEDGLADEHHALAALLHGPVAPADWRDGQARAADFFTVKGALEQVLATLRVPATYAPAEDAWPFLHPGRSAAVHVGDTRVGFVGEVHPAVAAAWDLPQTAAVFAVDLGKVLAAAPEVTTYADLTTFPALRLDLAVVLPDDVPAARMLEVVRAAGGNRLVSASVFDVYVGDQLGAGKRSLALHLEFRTPDATLTDADVAPARAKIVKKLASELGGELRG